MGVYATLPKATFYLSKAEKQVLEATLNRPIVNFLVFTLFFIWTSSFYKVDCRIIMQICCCLSPSTSDWSTQPNFIAQEIRTRHWCFYIHISSPVIEIRFFTILYMYLFLVFLLWLSFLGLRSWIILFLRHLFVYKASKSWWASLSVLLST